jgi:hypothetical protein
MHIEREIIGCGAITNVDARVNVLEVLEADPEGACENRRGKKSNM